MRIKILTGTSNVLLKNVRVRGQSLRSLRVKKNSLLRFKAWKGIVQLEVGAHTCVYADKNFCRYFQRFE